MSVFFPRPSNICWYVLIRYMWSTASMCSPEDVKDYVSRYVQIGSHISRMFSREKRSSVVALARGLAETVFFRFHNLNVQDFMDQQSVKQLYEFRAESERVKQCIMVTTHMGPIELQIDLVDGVTYPIVVLYQSYTWLPLKSFLFRLRLKRENMTYVKINRLSELLGHIKSGKSLVIVGDRPAKPSKAFQLFGTPLLSPLPLRISYKYKIPLYVGGFYHKPDGQLGFMYNRADDINWESAVKKFETAAETFVRANPADWIYFGDNRPAVQPENNCSNKNVSSDFIQEDVIADMNLSGI